MRIRVMAVVSLAVSAAVAVADDRSQDDARKLQGTWVTTSGFVDGKPAKEAVGIKMVFAGEKVTVGTHKDRKTVFALDATTEPKAIDLIDTEGDGGKVITRGIYKLEGDELQVCTGPVVSSFTTSPGGKTTVKPGESKRPTRFDAKQGELFTLKREKP